MSSFMAYCTAQAAPLEKSTTMPSHKLQPSAAGAGAAAGYVHMISSHSCSGILQEPSSRRSSQYSSYDLHPASVYVATTPCSLSNSLPCSDDLSGDKTMVVQGEELSPPPALLSKTTTTTCGGNRSWSSSSLDYPAAVAASFPSSVSLQNYCDDSSNNGGGQDWTQFSNSHATFFSNGGPTSTHHFSSQARCCWQPGFAGLNNIDDNLPPPPTGTNSSSTLNAAASASRQRLLSTIHDPSFASRFSYVNNNNSGYTCSHEQQRSHSLSAASEYTFFDGQDGFNAERESAIQGKSTAEEEADHHLDCRQPGLLQAEFMERETEDISATVAFEYDEEGAAAAAGQGRNSSSFRLSQNAAWESAFFVPRDGGAGARNPGGGMGKRKTTPPGPPQEEQQNNDHVYGTIRLEPCCFGGRDDAELLDSSDEAAAAKRFKAGELGDSSAQSFKAEQSTTSNHSGDESGSPHSMEDLNHHGLNLPLPPPDHQAPTQDYIHVRARRGQATDSHSLAERVRREKISERMKFLQDLVPSCSKLTGRAVMLDETINYVQSLQHQVEFLSMKLAAVNPQLDFHLESLLHKEMVQSCASPPTILMNSDHIVPHEQHPFQEQYEVPFQLASACATDFRDLELAVSEANKIHISSAPLFACITSMDSHGEPLSQTSNICESELQSVVQMGISADWDSLQNVIKVLQSLDKITTTSWQS
ncbi:hypothetical protein BDL97_04G072700 [Sphagnum fallax]|nr:hypothetical protein BDL97_04G072700 [Sphagnum fallax]